MSFRRMAAAFGTRLLRLGEHSHAVAPAAAQTASYRSVAAFQRHPGLPSLLPRVQTRAQHCSCPGMDKLPSNKLLVEYQPEEVDRFIEVADAVEEAFPGMIVEGIEAVEGAHTFAVKMEDGTVIFAHSGHSGSLPGNEELISVIRAAGAGEAET